MIPTSALQALPKGHIIRLANSKITRVSLQHLFSFGNHVAKTHNPLLTAQFLHQELPIRLTQTLKMINAHDVPYNLSNLPTFQKISERYVEDIAMLSATPKPMSQSEERDFTELLKELQQRQRVNNLSIGRGLQELLDTTNKKIDFTENNFKQFFDKYYTMALGTRTLLSEHVSLHERERSIVEKVSPLVVAKKAAHDARRICSNQYGFEAPEVEIISKNNNVSPLYIEEYLHRSLFEILKNSLKATVETHQHSNRLPPVKIVIVAGGEDVTIKVSDVGGGIPMSKINHLWRYTYSMPSNNGSSLMGTDFNHYMDIPLVGYGHGLSVARLISRYFGGDLNVVSMEGYGTDAYLHLFRQQSCLENLPEFEDVEMLFEPEEPKQSAVCGSV
ncbi:[Pyruvate dehydrogenase (acetyl-transferring)] kinase isozyme 2 [Basidiobolus ranarum]|uniref:Protein-serine/threonine kinase n=1 Tax=Basidiobolus ranarum TaxID=34480 RepID=A0ABR2WBQ7_9FUNG